MEYINYGYKKKNFTIKKKNRSRIGNDFKVFEQKGIKLQIFALIPIAIQGGGKGYFYNNIIHPLYSESNEITLKHISSQTINLKLIKSYQNLYPDTPHSKAFHETRKFFKSSYNEEIKNIFEEIKEKALMYQDDPVLGKKFIIYFEKNHPLNCQTQNNVIKKLREVSRCPLLKIISLNILHKEILSKDPFKFREVDYFER